MSDELSVFSFPVIKELVQDMRELLSQTHISFLLGAGCGKCAGLPLMQELTEQIVNSEKFDKESKKIINEVYKIFHNADNATIEHYMSEIIDLLSMANRRLQCGASSCNIKIGDHTKNPSELQKALDDIKQTIASTINGKEVDIKSHQEFIRAIHSSLQAGKDNRNVDYFVLNYDTLIEDALGLEQVAYTDGFKGGVTGWWEPITFTNNVQSVRVFKLHGSIDWCILENDLLPRRIRPGIKQDIPKRNVLIYPAATKYQETQHNPFSQMLTHFRQSLCPNDGKEMILAICGYSFGDSHIDTEIENALYFSEGRLTIAAFIETDEPTEKLNTWMNDPNISDQIRVYSNKGFFHGNKEQKFSYETPWWKFENLSRILQGVR